MADLRELLNLPAALEIRQQEGYGRGLVANTSIPKGSQVLRCTPYAHCTSEKARGSVCEYCLNSPQSLKKCSRCKVVYYCNSTCQQGDWPLHKAECDGVRTGRPTSLMRLALRLLAKEAQYRGGWTVEQLCAVPVDFLSTVDRNGEEVFMTGMRLLTDHSQQTLHLLLRKLICNTFSVYSADLSSVAVALYPAASLFNHSCVPNLVMVFSGSTLSVRSVKEISAGEQLFISYTETLQLYSQRQRELQRMYNFTCNCVRCLEDRRRGPNSVDRLLLMDTQGRELSTRQALEQQLSDIEELKANGYWRAVNVKARQLYDKHSSELPSGNIYHIQLTDLLFHSCLHLSQWSAALEYSSSLLGPTIEYYGVYHPVCVTQLLRTGKLRRLLGTTQELQLSIVDLTKAKEAALVVYGRDHAITLQAHEMLHDSQSELSNTCQ